MSKKYDVAIVGATGSVGETLISILDQRNCIINNLYPLASKRSAGSKVKCQGKSWTVEDLDTFDFSKVQIGVFSAGGDISEKYAPVAAAKGCVVIDNTSHFRRDEDIPLVVPEVNPHAIANYTNRNIIANPNCSTIQMLVALKPIYDAVGIDRINVATYQAVSGSGKEAITELTNQTANLLNGKDVEVEVWFVSSVIASFPLPETA
jgi:aspartate-semialdehyde dehydrogenase